jgi:tRNA threonylcarbamoyladenosine biosynthesis protein TsaB
VALILNIETATDTCSVALASDLEVLAQRTITEFRTQPGILASMTQECIEQAGFNKSKIDAIAVSKGPGSYTGLRIGVAFSKGLCYSLNIPLIGINTLQVLAATFLQQHDVPEDTLICPMIDARRMEVYTAFIKKSLEFFSETKAVVLDQDFFKKLIDKQPIIMIGSGVTKARQFFEGKVGVTFDEKAYPSATGMISFSHQSYIQKAFEDLAYFEPFYLKDFVGIKQPPLRFPRP